MRARRCDGWCPAQSPSIHRRRWDRLERLFVGCRRALHETCAPDACGAMEVYWRRRARGGSHARRGAARGELGLTPAVPSRHVEARWARWSDTPWGPGACRPIRVAPTSLGLAAPHRRRGVRPPVARARRCALPARAPARCPRRRSALAVRRKRAAARLHALKLRAQPRAAAPAPQRQASRASCVAGNGCHPPHRRGDGAPARSGTACCVGAWRRALERRRPPARTMPAAQHARR